MYLPPVDQQQNYQQYQLPYNHDQGTQNYQVPYQQTTTQYVQPEPQYQQQTFNPPTAEAEVWNISQNKASYVVSIDESDNRRNNLMEPPSGHVHSLLCCR